MFRRIVIQLVCLVATLGTATAQTPRTEPVRVGLVLSSGGARGLAQVGALQALEELRVPVDFVVGSETGALVGGFYASGLDPDEIVDLVSRPAWIDALGGKALRRSMSWRQRSVDRDYLLELPISIGTHGIGLARGLVGTRWISYYLSSATMPAIGAATFDELPTPFRAMVVDPLTGDVLALESGDLAAAIMASLSTPGRHAPIAIDGREFVTGALLAPIPVRTAIAAGAQSLIVIDCSLDVDQPERLGTFSSATSQVAVLAAERSRRESRALLRSQDVWIAPDLTNIGEQRFVDALLIFERGRAAVLAQRDQLEALALDEEEWSAHVAAREARRPELPVIGRIRIEDETGLDDSVFDARIRTKPGGAIDPDVLSDDLLRLYGLDYHQRIEPHFAKNEDGTTDLVIETLTDKDEIYNPRGGIAFEGVLGQDATIVFGTAFTLRPIDGRGAEWRNRVELGSRVLLFSEYWQPLDPAARWFIAPALAFEQERIELNDGVTTFASYDTTAFGGRVDIGHVLGEWGELRVGLVQDVGTLDLAIGDPSTASPGENFNEGYMQGTLTVDTLDSLALPRHGWVGRATYRAPVGFLAGQDLQYLTAQFDHARTWGRTTVVFGGEFDTAIDSQTAQQNSFQLGGFLRLSGLGRNTIGGPHVGLLRAVSWYALGHRGLERNPIDWNLGVSLEAGGTWLDRSDITVGDLRLGGSVFVALETVVGPIFAGVGFTEPSEVAVFLSFGNQFADWDGF